MYAATGNSALPSRPFLQRLLVGSWGFRHPAVSIAVRMVAGLWNLSWGIFLLSYGYVVGLVPLAGSALLFLAAFIVARAQSETGRNGQS